jgi:hypothetical protein
MSNRLSREMRDAILMEDMGWLGEITIHKVNGKLMLGDAALPFSVSHIMTEKEFVRYWLIQFAVANDVGNGRSYFNLEEWLSFTENGQRSVMIVTDEENPRPLMVIPPMLSHNLTQQDHDLMRRASILIHNSSANAMTKNSPNANLTVAHNVAEVLAKVKPRTLTEMVLPEFYERHSIIPVIEKRIYYIRDSIREGQSTDNEDLNRVRTILYRDFKDEPNTVEDHKFIDYMSQGRYEFKNEPVAGINTSQNAPKVTGASVGLNPDEC